MGNSIEEGKVYKIKNRATGKMLNLYGGILTNGTNICQYSDDGSDEQKWVRIGNKLYAYGSNTKCLDRYNDSTSTKHNNADIWGNNDNTNQNLVFTSSGNYVKIQLNSGSLYLTASTNPSTDSVMNKNGNKDEYKTTSSEGNIFWRTYNGNYSLWDAIDVSEGVNGEVVVEDMPRITTYASTGYKEYFHPDAGMIHGTWEGSNNGATLDNIIAGFYEAVYGVAPSSKQKYLYSLYGSKTNDPGTIFHNTYHHGVDINRYSGAPIKSAHSGLLIRASGNTIAIYDSDRNVTYLYLHCNINPELKVNTVINKNDPIGTESNVGLGANADTHLHIEVRSGRDSNPEYPSNSTSVSLPTLEPYNYLIVD